MVLFQEAASLHPGLRCVCQQQLSSADVAQRLQTNVALVNGILQHFMHVVLKRVSTCQPASRFLPQLSQMMLLAGQAQAG